MLPIKDDLPTSLTGKESRRLHLHFLSNRTKPLASTKDGGEGLTHKRLVRSSNVVDCSIRKLFLTILPSVGVHLGSFVTVSLFYSLSQQQKYRLVDSSSAVPTRMRRRINEGTEAMKEGSEKACQATLH